MNFKLLICLLAFTIHFPLIAQNAPNEADQIKNDIEVLKRKTQCIAEANLALAKLDNGIRYWFGEGDETKKLALFSYPDFTPDLDYSIPRNFRELVKKHEEVFSLIQKHVSEASIPESYGEMIELMDQIERGKVKLTRDVGSIYVFNQAFLSALSGADDFIEEMKILFGKMTDCGNVDESEAYRKKALSIVNDADLKFQKMRIYVAETQVKQQTIEDFAHRFYRERLLSKFAAKSGADLEDLHRKISATLLGAELHEEVLDFTATYNSSGSGAINQMLNVYLKYEEPLRLMRIELTKIEAYRKRMNSITDLPEALRQSITAKLDDYHGFMSKRLQRLEEKGWKYNLDAQTYYSKQRHTNLLKYGAASCQQKVAEYLSETSPVSSIEDYRIREFLYSEQVKSCEKVK
jgi:hypothetical protein